MGRYLEVKYVRASEQEQKHHTLIDDHTMYSYPQQHIHTQLVCVCVCVYERERGNIKDLIRPSVRPCRIHILHVL